PADIHTPIKANDLISVMPSTAGAPARMEVRSLPEFHQSIVVNVNGKKVELPKFALVNGSLQSGYYEIADGDSIEMQNFYTVAQILEFTDVSVPEGTAFVVNNMPADKDTPVYENFSVAWGEEIMTAERQQPEPPKEDGDREADVDAQSDTEQTETAVMEETAAKPPEPAIHDIAVVVNGSPLVLSGKVSYVYVDVFDYIDFDLKNPKGSGIVTSLNGQPAEYLKEIKDGDIIDIYWRN
ncbi:MAG: cell division protein FtsA, partial [Lachnospiraceae bacterium]